MFIGSDESLYSFITRNLLIHYPATSLNFLIRNNGNWTCHVRVPEQYQEIFHQYDDKTLLNAIYSDTILNEYDPGFFHLPDGYYTPINDIFFPTKTFRPTELERKIKFCLKCIHDSINHLGFSYLRRGWLRDSYCDIHQNALMELTKTYRIEARRNLIRILNGETPKLAIEMQLHTNFNKDIKKSFFYPIKILPCMFAYIKAFFTENIYTINLFFKEKNIELDHDFFSTILYDKRIDNVNIRLEQFFSLNNEIFTLGILNRWIEAEFDYTQVFIGKRQQLSEIILIPKKRNMDCNTCHHSKNNKCRDYLRDGTILNSKDLTSLSQHSYSFNRLNNDPRLRLTRLGDALWHPIKYEKK